MEFKARYELIGAFTLAVIAMLFGFVYWLNNGGGHGEQTIYKVQFNNPVSGLLVGGGVSFNGIRVGEVSGLGIDPQNPSRLSVMITVRADTPVRDDTQVGIDYQGLTGISGIALSGGSPNAPPLQSSDGQPGLLVANTKAGNNWTQSANQVLSQLEVILNENKKPLKDILANFATFSDVLAGKKERLESILNGLERMTGGSGKVADKVIYDLIPPTKFTALAKPPSWRLVINEPTVLLALNTDKIQQRPSSGQTMALGIARWSDNLPNLFQEKIIQSYENAGYSSSVLRPIEGEDTDNKLLLNIRGFHLSTSGEPTAQIEFIAKLMDGSGKIIASRSFKASSPAEKDDGAATAKALGKAFAKSVTELISWSTDLL